MSLFYPPNFWGVHRSRQLIESNPHPPPHLSHLRYIAFSWVTRSPKQEAPSRRHHQNAQQTCVTSLDLRAMEESLQQFCAKWQLDPEAQNFLRSDFLGIARNCRIPASPAEIFQMKIHGGNSHEKWSDICHQNSPTLPPTGSVDEVSIKPMGFPSNPWVKTPTFVGRKRSVSWAVNLGKCCRVDRNPARV